MSAAHSMTLLLLAGVLLGGCSGAVERHHHYLERAERYYAEGDYEKARVDVLNALQINPEFAPARVLYARVLVAENRWEEALANALTAVELDPELASARVQLGALYLSGLKFDAALAEAEAAVAAEPDHADGHALKAGAHFRLGEQSLAVSAARQALSLEPGNVNAVAVLTQIHKADHPELALSIIEEGLGQSPETATRALLQISVYQEHGRLEAADAAFDALLSDYPGNLYCRRLHRISGCRRRP